MWGYLSVCGIVALTSLWIYDDFLRAHNVANQITVVHKINYLSYILVLLFFYFFYIYA